MADDIAPVDPATAAPVNEQISLGCSAEYNCYPLTEQACWSIASFKAPFYEPTSRASVDIVAVIDKSGSMRGEKIKLVRKTLLFVIDQLKECDRMSLVTYDSCVALNFPLMKMTKDNREKAKSFCEKIREGSCTNLCGGLLKGMEQIALTADDADKAKVQSVLLLTDGLANEGITGTANILDEIKKFQTEGLGAVNMSGVRGPPPAGGPPQIQRRQMRQQRRGPPRTGPPPPQNPGFFARLFGNSSQQPSPPPQQAQVQQVQQAPVQQMQQQVQPAPVPQQDPADQQQQPPAPPLVPPQPQQNILLPQLGDSDEDMEVDLPEEDPKPKPPGAKFDGTLYTFGFGSDHDATLLEAISTQGGGVYYYIDTNEKIPESFADCLGGLLSVVAQNLSLSIELVGGNAVSQVHGNRAINWSTPNKSCSITMGDLQSEEERDVVLELCLPTLGSPQVDHVLKTTLSYFNVITSSLDTVTFDLHIDRKDGPQGKANEVVDMQKNRVLTTRTLLQTEALADQGRMKEAQDLLRGTISEIEASPSWTNQCYTQALTTDLLTGLSAMATDSSYKQRGKKMLRSKAQSHQTQRSNRSEDVEFYKNSSRMAMISKVKGEPPIPKTETPVPVPASINPPIPSSEPPVPVPRSSIPSSEPPVPVPRSSIPGSEPSSSHSMNEPNKIESGTPDQSDMTN